MATNAPSRVKKLINAVEDIVPESLAGPRGGASRPRQGRPGPEPRPARRRAEAGQGRPRSPAAAPATNRSTAGSSAWACSMRPPPATSSPRPCRTRWRPRPAPSMAAPASSTSSRTTPATSSTSSSRPSSSAGEIEVATVVTNDDVAVQDSLYTAGRRGVGVTVLLEKIAGAHAEAGGSLAEVTATATKVNDQGRSMGLALTSCVVPAAGTPTFDLATTRSRSGSASTGSPVGAARSWRRSTTWPSGSSRRSSRPRPVARRHACSRSSTAWVARRSSSCTSRSTASPGSSAARASRSAARSSGNYITSLEMAGFSVTLLRLDDELTALWDAPVHTPALRWGV